MKRVGISSLPRQNTGKLQIQSCVVTHGQYPYAGSALVPFPRILSLVSVGDELISYWGLPSHQAQLSFLVLLKRLHNAGRSTWRLELSLLQSFLGRRQLGYVHSTEAINIRVSLIRIRGATGTAGLTVLPDWPCLLCSLSFTAIVSTR